MLQNIALIITPYAYLQWFGTFNWVVNALRFNVQTHVVEVVPHNDGGLMPECKGYAIIFFSGSDRNMSARVTNESLHRHRYAMRLVLAKSEASQLPGFWQSHAQLLGLPPPAPRRPPDDMDTVSDALGAVSLTAGPGALQHHTSTA